MHSKSNMLIMLCGCELYRLWKQVTDVCFLNTHAVHGIETV